MDYTKNYHLPQWVKDDRIMMEDFNQMCADIEAGLGRNAQAAAAAAKTADAAATPADLRNGLFRMACNHLSLLLEAKNRPWQAGVVCKDFEADSGNLPDGMVQRPGFAWTANDGEVLSMENIQPSLSVSSEISADSGSKTMTLAFTAPGSGWIMKVRMLGTIQNTSGSKGDCTVYFNDLTSGARTEERNSFNLRPEYMYGGQSVDVNLPVISGHRYRLTITMDDLNANPKWKFDSFTLSSSQSDRVSVTCVPVAETAALGGIALVRYRCNGGTASLSWDGTTLSPCRVRSVTYRGVTVQEAEFRRETAVSAGDQQVTATINCPAGSDLELYAVCAAVV